MCFDQPGRPLLVVPDGRIDLLKSIWIRVVSRSGKLLKLSQEASATP